MEEIMYQYLEVTIQLDKKHQEHMPIVNCNWLGKHEHESKNWPVDVLNSYVSSTESSTPILVANV